jgi:hypothetical protein
MILGSEMRMIARFYDWLNLKDFDQALEEARVSVIKRFARGNVTFQNGYILDEFELEKVQQLGDSAVKEIQVYGRADCNDERESVRR